MPPPEGTPDGPPASNRPDPPPDGAEPAPQLPGKDLPGEDLPDNDLPWAVEWELDVDGDALPVADPSPLAPELSPLAPEPSPTAPEPSQMVTEDAEVESAQQVASPPVSPPPASPPPASPPPVSPRSAPSSLASPPRADGLATSPPLRATTRAAARTATRPAAPPLAEEAAPPVEQILEAMLFVGGPPLTAATVCRILRGLSPEDVAAAIDALNRRYRRQNRPYAIERRGDGWSLTVLPAYRGLRERLYGGTRAVRLSPAALDTLAIIAYRQPVTKAEIDAVRGADSAAAIRQLLRLGFIAVTRRAEGGEEPSPEPSPQAEASEVATSPQAEASPETTGGSPDVAASPEVATSPRPSTSEPSRRSAGRGVCYGTTPQFLKHFGLGSLDDLPRLAPSPDGSVASGEGSLRTFPPESPPEAA